MKSVAFFNNKGGVGKTTLLCNVAAFLSLYEGKRVLVVDADPQCNATQLMLSDIEIEDVYSSKDSFTIQKIIHPLSIGKGYGKNIDVLKRPEFGLDLICGDPNLALKEDLLSKDWQESVAGNVRGLRTSFLFRDLLEKCGDYDYVFFDVGPSLGSINRAVLLASDAFLSPMSIDIFSLRAIENISKALVEWRKKLELGISLVDEDELDELPNRLEFDLRFIGYVAQQYNQKTSQVIAHPHFGLIFWLESLRGDGVENDVEGVPALETCGVDGCSHVGFGLSGPHGAVSVGDFSLDHAGTQFAFRAVICGIDLAWIVAKGEKLVPCPADFGL